MPPASFNSLRKALVASAATVAVFAVSYTVACEVPETTAPVTTAPTTVTTTPSTTTTTTTTTTAPAPATTTTGTTTPAVNNAVSLVGVNLSGAEFGTHLPLPGTYGVNYTYPTEANFKRYSELGMKLVRLPFRWERLQSKLNTELNAAELARLVKTLDYAKKYNVQVILDMHNEFRYFGKVVGSPEVPLNLFANTWRRISLKLVNHPAVYGYGLMSKLHDTNGQWPAAAMKAATAIRAVDKQKWIFISGDGYANAQNWAANNSKLVEHSWMRYAPNKLVYEANVYLDKNASGTYANTSETFDPMVGVNRAKPFVDWLTANKLRGFVGEHGAPDWSPSAITATDNLLTYLRQNCIPSTYWSAGPWWGEYALSLDVKSGKYRPQLPVLQKHAATQNSCTSIGPLK